MRLFNFQQIISTAYHLQTDGSSEITNQMIENYLRCFCHHNQRKTGTTFSPLPNLHTTELRQAISTSPRLSWTLAGNLNPHQNLYLAQILQLMLFKCWKQNFLRLRKMLTFLEPLHSHDRLHKIPKIIGPLPTNLKLPSLSLPYMLTYYFHEPPFLRFEGRSTSFLRESYVFIVILPGVLFFA